MCKHAALLLRTVSGIDVKRRSLHCITIGCLLSGDDQPAVIHQPWHRGNQVYCSFPRIVELDVVLVDYLRGRHPIKELIFPVVGDDEDPVPISEHARYLAKVKEHRPFAHGRTLGMPKKPGTVAFSGIGGSWDVTYGVVWSFVSPAVAEVYYPQLADWKVHVDGRHYDSGCFGDRC